MSMFGPNGPGGMTNLKPGPAPLPTPLPRPRPARSAARSALRSACSWARSAAACARSASRCARSASLFCANTKTLGSSTTAAMPMPLPTPAPICANAGPASVRRTSDVLIVFFMGSLLTPLHGERARTRRVRLLALPQLVAEHADLEEQRRRVDAAPGFIEPCRSRARWRVDDLEQIAFELVEHDCDRVLAGVDRVLPVETVGGDEIFGPALFGRDVAAGRRVNDVGKHAFRPIEMIGDGREQNPIAAFIAAGGRRRCRRAALVE